MTTETWTLEELHRYQTTGEEPRAPQWPQMMHTVLIDNLRTISEANRSQREHWSSIHRRAKAQRTAVYHWLRHLLPPVPPLLPLIVTLTRIAPRPLDTDNLSSALKACTDGCADYLSGAGFGAGQDRRDGLLWYYAQRRGKPKQYGIEIVIEQVPIAPPQEGSR